MKRDSYKLVVIASQFPVVGLISTICLPPFMSFNEFGEVARLLRHPHKLVLQEVTSGWTLEWCS